MYATVRYSTQPSTCRFVFVSWEPAQRHRRWDVGGPLLGSGPAMYEGSMGTRSKDRTQRLRCPMPDAQETRNGLD